MSSRRDAGTLPEQEAQTLLEKVKAALVSIVPASRYKIEDLTRIAAIDASQVTSREAKPVSARLDLPTDQKIYLSMAQFMQTSPLLGTQLFRLDAHRGTMRVDLLESTSKSVLKSVSYSYATSEDSEITSLEDAISRDFADTASHR